MSKHLVRLMIAVFSAALLLSACGGNSDNNAASNAPATSTVDVSLADFMIMPMNIETKAGTVMFHVHNDGQAPHNFVISRTGSVVAKSKDLNPGESQDVKASLTAADYITYCSEPGHESLGMRGTLKVT